MLILDGLLTGAESLVDFAADTLAPWSRPPPPASIPASAPRAAEAMCRL